MNINATNLRLLFRRIVDSILLFMQKSFQPINPWSGIIAALVITGLLVAGWMTVSPELHEHLHHDSDEAGHECLEPISKLLKEDKS